MMPQLMGEVPLLTLFADVHYYFSPPTARPLHHRFDKTSYVYLYHHPAQGRGRLEIANNAGTAEQDAFMGYLDTVQVDRSYKHPNLYTITVDGRAAANGHSSPSPQQDMSQWHLPTYDLRSEAKYMYRLHTIDLYFWTTDDADKFLEALKRVVPEDRIRLRDRSSSHYEHRDTMSPVVQKLEQVAISKPYQGRTASVSTTKSYQSPPTAVSTSSTSTSATSPPSTEAPPHYAPMAYNPAAPAAPEPIAHREKTPPPPDAQSGTGLAAAAQHDHSSPYNSPPQQQHPSYPQYQQQFHPSAPHSQSNPSFSPPLQRASTTSSFPPPPPPQQPSSAGPPTTQHAFAPPPTDPYSQPAQPGQQPGQMLRQHTTPASYAPYPQQQQQQQQPYADYAHPPLQSPGLPPPNPAAGAMPGPHAPPPPTQPQHIPHVQYGQYGSYGQPQQAEAYNIHSQVYRPTNAEAAYGHHTEDNYGAQAPGAAPAGGRLEQGLGKVEKGVGRFLKRLDKKL